MKHKNLTKNKEMFDNIFGFIAFFVLLILILTAVGLSIYNIIKLKQLQSSTNTTIDEIKSKIGSMIRQINAINKIDYTVDMEQQSMITNLRSKLL